MTATLTNLLLHSLADDINREHGAVKASFRQSVEHAIKVGRLLLKAKERVQHGQWGDWLSENTEISARMASSYMRLSRDLPALDEANQKRVSDLSFREALAVLAEERSIKSEFVGGGVTVEGRVISSIIHEPPTGARAADTPEPNNSTYSSPRILFTPGNEETIRVKVQDAPDFNPIAMQAPFYQMIRTLLDCSEDTKPGVLADRLKDSDLQAADFENLAAWLADAAIELERRRA